MPYPIDRRPPNILEQPWPAAPLPPLNILVTTGFEKEMIDIRWTSPTELQANSKFNVIGVNVYRSFDSEYGPYTRLTDIPIGSNFYRDKTRVVVVLQEDVSNSFTVGGPNNPADPSGKLVFKTAHQPIFIGVGSSIPNCTNLVVSVTVNGIPAFVQCINGVSGEIELMNNSTFDVISQTLQPAVIPTSSSDVVLVTYKYIDNKVKTNLDQKIYYRLTTVAVDDSGNLIETSLERATQSSNRQAETLDYIWREAVRRNRFLLTQAGERVKLFIRKNVGPKCGCYSNLHGQSSSVCAECFGTEILGGYDGPYDVLISPDDGDRALKQSNRGRTFSHNYDTWMGPSPIVSQRDFIVKLNGDRYGLASIRMPSNRGMILQQFFKVSHLDEGDIRYKVPVLDTTFLAFPQTRYIIPGKGNATPMMTERDSIPDEREIRGNTVEFENELRK